MRTNAAVTDEETPVYYLSEADDLADWFSSHAKKATGNRKAKLLELADKAKIISKKTDDLGAELQTIAAEGLSLTERAARRK